MARSRTTWTAETRLKGPGRPRGLKESVPRANASNRASVRWAWRQVTAEEPDLTQEAIRKGLKGDRTGRVSHAFLELGARLEKEIGNGHDDGAGRVAVIILDAGGQPLDINMVRQRVLAQQAAMHAEAGRVGGDR